MSSDFSKRSNKSSSIWQERITKHVSWPCADRGENLERIYSGGRHGRFGNVRRIRYVSSESQRERDPDQTKNDEFTFTFADGTAKLSGRDYEVRESLQGGIQP